MSSVVTAALILLTLANGTLQQLESADAWLARWNDEVNKKLVLGALWTASHTTTDERMGEVFDPVAQYLEALRDGDRSVLRPDRIAEFKKRASTLLDHHDQALRALGAVLIGVSGDKSYAAALGRLLEPMSIPGLLPRFDRGRAAIALGLVGAKEYAPDLAALLKSTNSFDRSGAALGLGFLGATEYEAAIAALLNDPEGDVSEMAKESLAIMRKRPR